VPRPCISGRAGTGGKTTERERRRVTASREESARPAMGYSRIVYTLQVPFPAPLTPQFVGGLVERRKRVRHSRFAHRNGLSAIHPRRTLFGHASPRHQRPCRRVFARVSWMSPAGRSVAGGGDLRKFRPTVRAARHQEYGARADGAPVPAATARGRHTRRCCERRSRSCRNRLSFFVVLRVRLNRA
jgi:hypothetical protein